MKHLSLLSTLLIGGLFSTITQSFAQTGNSAFQPYNTQGDNVIHVTTADFDAVGAKDYVVAMTVNGKVIAFERPDQITSPSTDNRLWEYTDLPSMGMRIFADEVIGSSTGEEVILPGTDGHLRILSSTGQLLIDKVVSSGALYTATIGKDHNGQTIIATSGVDGFIYFLDTNGTLLTTFRPKTNSISYNAGLIRHLVAGDYDGDGTDEVVAFVNRKNFSGACFIDVVDLETFERPSYFNGETDYIEDNVGIEAYSSGLGFTDKQLPHAYDMDGDGDDEVVGHWGVFHPENGPGTLLFSTMLSENEKLPISAYNNFAQSYLIANNGFKKSDKEYMTNTGKYLMQHGIPGDFDNDGEAELFTVYGDDLFLSDYTSSSKTLSISDYTWAHTNYHFSDGACLQDRNGGPDKVVLAGPIIGDDHFYVVDVTDSNWNVGARTINGAGSFGEIEQNLDQLTSDVNQFAGVEAESDEPILFLAGSFKTWLGWPMTAENIETRAQGVYDAQQEWYAKIGGNKNVRMVGELSATVYGVSNDGDDPDITAEGLVEYCRALAQKGAYFSLKIGHGSHQYMTAENLADCFEASIVNGECHLIARTRELKDPAYFDIYKPHLDALIDRAATLGVEPPKVMFCAKGAVFSLLTQAQTDEFFGTYKHMVVPGVENSNVSVLEWSLAERVGLWMNGDVPAWGCNIIGDNLSANRVAEWGGMRNAHVILRQMFSQYALGARVFRLTSVTSLDNPLYERGDVSGADQEWTQVYEKGVLNFLKLVEKGVYPASPKPEQMKAISPVSVAIHNGSARLLNQSRNHDHHLYEAETQEYAIGKLASWYAYTDVYENDLTSYLYGTKRRWDNLIPATSGGFVTIIPDREASEVENNNWCNQAFQTNGDSWDNYSLATAKDVIPNEVMAQRNNLDFYVEGECFWQVAQQKNDSNTNFMILMGNSVLSPVERTVTLKASNNIASCEIIDQMSGISLGSFASSSDELTITIPRGTPRILCIKSTAPTMPNGDFEAELINWETWKTANASSDAYYGNWAGELTGNAYLRQWVDLKPNTTYTLSAFAKVLDPENGSVNLSVRDKDNNLITSVDVTETDYTAYRMMFTTGSEADSTKISYLRGKDGIGNAYLDEVVIKETAYALNADFEKGLSTWDYYGGTSIETASPISGTASARIDAKGGISQFIKTKPATTYIISFTAMVEDPSKEVRFNVKDVSGSKYFEQKVYDTQATNYSITFTTNAGEEDSKISFWRPNGAVGGAWLDNVTITEVPAGTRTGVTETLQPEALNFKVFPNPASDFVTISSNQANGIKSLVLYNIVGQPVLSQTFRAEHKLSVADLNKGTYILVVTDQSGNRKTSKLFVD